jgi:hypothetical protein
MYSFKKGRGETNFLLPFRFIPKEAMLQCKFQDNVYHRACIHSPIHNKIIP